MIQKHHMPMVWTYGTEWLKEDKVLKNNVVVELPLVTIVELLLNVEV
jgi:hypothetical protein